MTVPGEGSNGVQPNQLTEEAYMDLLDGLDEAGWFSAGGYGTDLPLQLGITRHEGRGSITEDQAILLMKLDDPSTDSGLLPGYEITTDAETGATTIGYEGLPDARFEEFLQDAIIVGHRIDQELIKNSSYPDALENWRLRHLASGWAEASPSESFEPFLDEDLKALRDHVVFKEGGLFEFQELSRAYTRKSSLTDSDIHPRLMVSARLDIEATLSWAPDEAADAQLDIELLQADQIIKDAIEASEVALLQDPEVAGRFVREVLVDNPKQGEPLTEEAFAEAVDCGNSPFRTQEDKLTLLALVAYYSRGSMSPKGIHLLLDAPQKILLNKTPREIIDSGSEEEVKDLLGWRRDGR
jgi:hypothetical protein